MRLKYDVDVKEAMVLFHYHILFISLLSPPLLLSVRFLSIFVVCTYTQGDCQNSSSQTFRLWGQQMHPLQEDGAHP